MLSASLGSKYEVNDEGWREGVKKMKIVLYKLLRHLVAPKKKNTLGRRGGGINE